MKKTNVTKSKDRRDDRYIPRTKRERKIVKRKEEKIGRTRVTYKVVGVNYVLKWRQVVSADKLLEGVLFQRNPTKTVTVVS